MAVKHFPQNFCQAADARPRGTVSRVAQVHRKKPKEFCTCWMYGCVVLAWFEVDDTIGYYLDVYDVCIINIIVIIMIKQYKNQIM